MPRHLKAKKDVQACEKHRGAGKERKTCDVRMGEPNAEMHYLIISKVVMRSEPGEVKHLSNPRKRNQPKLRE